MSQCSLSFTAFHVCFNLQEPLSNSVATRESGTVSEKEIAVHKPDTWFWKLDHPPPDQVQMSDGSWPDRLMQKYKKEN